MSELWTPAGRMQRRAHVPPGEDFEIDLPYPYGKQRLIYRGELGSPNPEVKGTMRLWQSPSRYGLRVLASKDATQHGPLLHVSISSAERDPSWNEIKAVKAHFFGDRLDAMMVLPRQEDYVNVHEHTFHLWQTPFGWEVQ